MPTTATDQIALALHLATSIVGLIPEPDPELRRARYVQRLTALVARLEARVALTPAQTGRLAGARAALDALDALAAGQ